MLYISDHIIDELIKEDIPYIDLTTLLLGISDQKGTIQFFSREDAVICGVEEVNRIFRRLGIESLYSLPSGSKVSGGELLLKAQGNVGNLHQAWKVSLNILEYCSGIASRTRRLVDKAKAVNPKIEVVTTRKNLPGTKELAIKAIVAGGALPHRLGLSETILVFEQHMNFLGGFDGLLEGLAEIRGKSLEKKVIVEVKSLEDAIKLCRAGVDGIQLDKIEPERLLRIVNAIKEIDPRITLIATGGVNEGNVEAYTRTGVDVIATSAVYFGKPVDIKVTIEPFI